MLHPALKARQGKAGQGKARAAEPEAGRRGLGCSRAWLQAQGRGLVQAADPAEPGRPLSGKPGWSRPLPRQGEEGSRGPGRRAGGGQRCGGRRSRAEVGHFLFFKSLKPR